MPGILGGTDEEGSGETKGRNMGSMWRPSQDRRPSITGGREHARVDDTAMSNFGGKQRRARLRSHPPTVATDWEGLEH
jgi:hypothetical protein